MTRKPIEKLTGADTRRFHEALLAAFPSWNDLARMVRIHLDENLDALVARGSLGASTFELITWAESRGRLDELLTGALDANPGNQALRAFNASLPQQPPSVATATAAPALTPPPATPGPAVPTTPARPVDPVLAEIQAAYGCGDLILFVGSGVSAAAGLPSRKSLVELLLERARARGASGAELDEIADLLGKGRIIEALSAVKACLGAPEFGAAVQGLLDDRVHVRSVPPIGLAIAALAPRLRAVLTTSIDGLLDRAFLGEWPAIARATGDIARQRGYILKLHGTLRERSTWCFTLDDHERVMYADPLLHAAFSALFNTCPILFVGYGLDDDDFDQALSRVRALSGGQAPRHFALVPRQTITPSRRNRVESAGVVLVPYDNMDETHAELINLLRAIPM